MNQKKLPSILFIQFKSIQTFKTNIRKKVNLSVSNLISRTKNIYFSKLFKRDLNNEKNIILLRKVQFLSCSTIIETILLSSSINYLLIGSSYGFLTPFLGIAISMINNKYEEKNKNNNISPQTSKFIISQMSILSLSLIICPLLKIISNPVIIPSIILISISSLISSLFVNPFLLKRAWTLPIGIFGSGVIFSMITMRIISYCTFVAVGANPFVGFYKLFNIKMDIYIINAIMAMHSHKASKLMKKGDTDVFQITLEFYTFITYYQSISLYINSSEIIDFLTITNKENNVICENWNSKDLCSNSDFCQSYGSNKINTQIRINECIGTIYIYIKQKKTETNFSNQIVLFFSLDKNTKSICDSEIITSTNSNNSLINILKCSKLSLNECKDSCNRGCLYTSCQSNITNKTNEIYGLCLPNNLDPEQYNYYCNSNEKVNVFKNIDKCSDFYAALLSDSKKYSFWTILIIVCLITFILVVIIYRYQYKKTGKPPFKVFPCCPYCLFPRSEFNPAHQLDL